MHNKYGGVAAFVSDNLCVSRRKNLASNNIESLWRELKQLNSTSLLIGIVYRVPDALVHWFNFF